MRTLLIAAVLLGFAFGFATGRGAWNAFLGVISAAIAGTIVGAFSIATFVVVQWSRAQPGPRDVEARREGDLDESW